MSREVILHAPHPGLTVQDLGRPGHLAYGVSRGGAADRQALAEGAALLRQPETLAALEMAGVGGCFEATEDLRIALTGAPMQAEIDTAPLAWNASHSLPKGARLTIGAAISGTYGYLHVGGGVETTRQLGAYGTHLAAGLGSRFSRGDRIAVGEDTQNQTGMKIEPTPRFEGGTVRIVPSLQTPLFSPSDIARFEATEFRRDTRGNRMGVRLLQDGSAFRSSTGLSVLSEVIVPGDIQITGDGTPFVLLVECQTTGGYPRIGSVLPVDLPIVAQAQPGVALRFQFVTLEEAVNLERETAVRWRGVDRTLSPLLRDPASMGDLLSYNLVSGVTAGDTA